MDVEYERWDSWMLSVENRVKEVLWWEMWDCDFNGRDGYFGIRWKPKE